MPGYHGELPAASAFSEAWLGAAGMQDKTPPHSFLVAEFPGPKKVNLCIVTGLFRNPKKLKVTYSATKVWGLGFNLAPPYVCRHI